MERYFNFKAYGKANPGEDDNPTLCQANTLHFHKKALSYFMPRKRPDWDDILQQGNPTKSHAVNNVISRLKLHEVHGTGVATSARRPFEFDEYLNLLVTTWRLFNPDREPAMLRLLAVLTVQWHLMGRIDDIMKLAISTFIFNSCHPFTLHIKMCWSKNIRNERQLPTQIMFASMDPIVCPLMNLVTMNEVVGTDGDFLFGRSNKSAAQQLKLVYSSEFFTSQQTGQVGMHSVRKGSATFASRSGCHKDWINQRGRWRGGKQQVDTYIDSYQPYPDARVASVLCGPRGPCKYVINDDVVMMAGFLESIMPNSHEVFGSDIAKVLALPLLWAAFERKSPCKGISQLIIPSQ